MERTLRLFWYRFKKISFIFLLFQQVSYGVAQDVQESTSIAFKESCYLEIGGNGLWYAFNYDRILNKNDRTTTAGRVGFSYLGNFGNDNTVTIPLTISFLIGKSKNFFELGGGPTMLHSFNKQITGIAALGIVGYRHQPMKKKGVIYRTALTPFIGEYSTDKGYWNWVPMFWGGISFGFVF